LLFHFVQNSLAIPGTQALQILKHPFRELQSEYEVNLKGGRRPVNRASPGFIVAHPRFPGEFGQVARPNSDKKGLVSLPPPSI
jgi:hypothetical protein